MGALAGGLRLPRAGHLGDGVRGRRGARAWAPTRRRSSCGWRWACRASGSSAAPARRTSGRRARPGRAGPARSCTSTAASSSAPTTTCPAGRTSASWSTGTWCSCSTTRTRHDGTLRAAAAAGEQHRHRPRAQPHGRDPAGQGVGVRDRPVQPLIELGEELSGQALRRGRSRATARCGSSPTTPARCTFLIADGVVPSNEDRGYVLRRVMRRAIQQGRVLGWRPASWCATRSGSRELMGGAYPELLEQRDGDRHVAGRRGGELRAHAGAGHADCSEELIERARDAGAQGIAAAEDAFRLHDTFGFPFDLTRELVAERGPGVDREGFERADGRPARARARGGGTAARSRGRRRDPRPRGRERFAARAADFVTSFTGYETTEQPTTWRRCRACRRRRRRRRSGEDAATGVGALPRQARRVALLRRRRRPGLRRAARSNASSGDCRARVEDVFRLGDDQALSVVVERGTLGPGRAGARAGGPRRAGARPSATTPPPICCTRRCASGSATHVRQAGSYVGPDKLRFDFSHGRGADRRGAARRRGPGQRVDPRATTRCARSRRRWRRPASWARWRCSARSTARSCGWSRSARASTRASCAAAPTSAPRPRSGLPDPQRDLERGQRAAHRGAQRPGRGRAAARARRAGSRRSPPSCAPGPRAPPRPCARELERRRLEKELEERRGNGGGAGRRGSTSTSCSPRRRPRSTARACSLPPSRRPTRRPCWSCSTASRASSRRRGDRARRRAATAACTWSSSVAPTLVERGVKAGADRQGGGRRGGRRRRRTRHDRPGGRARRSEKLRARRIASARRERRPIAARARRRLMRCAGARLRQRPLRLRGQRPHGHDRDAARAGHAAGAHAAGSARWPRCVAEREVERSSSGCRCRSRGEDTAQTRETREFAERLAAAAGGGGPGRAPRRALHDRMAQRLGGDRGRRGLPCRGAHLLEDGWLSAAQVLP